MTDLTNINKVLIIRLSSLGDVLLTSPVVRALKNLKPSIEIHQLVKSEYADAVKLNPKIEKIYTWNKKDSKKEFKLSLKKENYDAVIDLQNNIRSRGITSGLAAKIYRFHKPSIKKMLLVKFKWNKFEAVKSIPQLYAENIDNLTLDEKGLELHLSEEIESKLAKGKKYAGFCPGSRHFTKMWPKEYFISLIKEINEFGFTPVLLGGKDDRETCAFIAGKTGALDHSNNDDLFQTAADMKMCNFVLCNDSGLMHVASALNVPLIAIFGSTVKEFGFRPYRCKNLVLENNSLNCRPCSHIGRDSCPKKHFKCMIDIDPIFVKNSILNFLKYL